MSTRSFDLPRRVSIRAVLVLAAVAIGLTAFAGPASANFTLNKGTLKLINGSRTGAPPSNGSWVRLLTDDPTAVPNFFPNPTTTATTTEYTLIDGSGAGIALKLGTAQPGGGIFGPLTSFNGLPFSAHTHVAPTLTFAGADNGTGTRTLVHGNLLGLTITYAGATYDVSTSSTPGPDRIVPLHGSIHGNATSTSPTARITLDWTTDLTQGDFAPFRAQFHWDGTYNPHP
jgi:hypothetical protein